MPRSPQNQMDQSFETEMVSDDNSVSSGTQTQTQVSSITRTKMGIAVTFLGFAAVAAAAAGVAGKNCVSNKVTVIDNGAVRVCEQETLVTKSSGYGLTMSRYTNTSARVLVNNPEQWYVSDPIGGGVPQSPSSIVIPKGATKVFSLVDGAMYVSLTYNGMYKNYATFSVEVNMGGGSKIETNCVDTDGGKVFETVGTVTLTSNDGTQSSSTDFCVSSTGVNSTAVWEYYCVDSSDYGPSSTFTEVGYKSVTTTCQYGCMDGACVASTTLGTVSTSPYSYTGPIKGDKTSIVWYAFEGKKFLFEPTQVYNSWYEDFSVIKKEGQELVDGLSSGGYVCARPGSYLIKFSNVNDPNIYYPGKNCTLTQVDQKWVEQWYGSNWAQKVVDYFPAKFYLYKEKGKMLNITYTFIETVPDSAIIKDVGNKFWYITNGMKSEISIDTTTSIPGIIYENNLGNDAKDIFNKLAIQPGKILMSQVQIPNLGLLKY